MVDRVGQIQSTEKFFLENFVSKGVKKLETSLLHFDYYRELFMKCYTVTVAVLAALENEMQDRLVSRNFCTKIHDP